MSHSGFGERDVPGRGNSKRKGPALGTCPVCPRARGPRFRVLSREELLVRQRQIMSKERKNKKNTGQ